jgi:hypothetical protein
MSKYWSDVFQNAIGCAIGSAVAIAFSFLIYWLSVINSSRARKKEKLENEINQLRAFKVMLQRAIQTSDNLIEHIGKFITNLKAHPNEFPLLSITSLGNFRRITESITVEKTLAIYIKHFPGENPVMEFTLILENIDFLFDFFVELQQVIQRASINHFNRVLKVSDRFDVADKMVIDVTSDPRNQNPITQRIAEIKSKFTSGRGELSNIDSINNLYLFPMLEFMVSVINGEIYNEFIRDFTYNLSKGIEFYNQLGSGYDKFVLEMNENEKSVKEGLEKLKVLAEKILKKNLE